MIADKQIYECSCGYSTHFIKALEAHCRFRHHEPKKEEPETILPEVEKEVVKAVKRAEKAEKPAETEKKTRRPRAKKSAAKE